MTLALRFGLPVLLVAAAACSGNPSTNAPAPAPAPGTPSAQPAPAATPSVPASTPAAPAAAAPAAPAAAVTAADLTGDWGWSLDLGGQTISGTMTITRSGASWGGTVVPDGMQPATVRTVTITGERITIAVDAPEGEAIVEGTLTADRRTLSGTLTYNGMAGSFTGRKR